MLKIKSQYDFWVDATAVIPTDNSSEKHKFKVHFRYEPQQQNKVSETMDDTQLIHEMGKVIIGWDNIHDMDGNALPYNTENLKKLMNNIFISKAITTAWQSALMGNPKLGN